VSCPTRYATDSSSINLRRSIKYGLGVLRTCGQYRLYKHGLRRYPYLDFDPVAAGGPASPADQMAEPTAPVSESARADG
jgi:hypothetical protein